MQPDVAPGPAQDVWLSMEHAMLDVRRHWFGAAAAPVGCAVSVTEPGGELIMLLDGSPSQADEVIGYAAQRGACVVATNRSHPSDIGDRLLASGFRLVQRHGAYIFDPDRPPPVRRERSGLLSFLHLRERLPITVSTVGADELPTWNDICWRSFGSKGLREAALEEKQRAFRSMGSAGRWYLAHVGRVPAGTACLYLGHEAAHVLAVGTLPSFRGRGVASAVMQQLVRDWRTVGSGVLFLDTAPDSRAEKLYLQLGFRLHYLRDLYAPRPPAP